MMFADFMESLATPTMDAEVRGIIQMDVHLVAHSNEDDQTVFDEPDEIAHLWGTVSWVRPDRSVIWYGLTCGDQSYLCRDRLGQQIDVKPGSRVRVAGSPEFVTEDQIMDRPALAEVEMKATEFRVGRHVSGDAGFPLGELWELIPVSSA